MWFFVIVLVQFVIQLVLKKQYCEEPKKSTGNSEEAPVWQLISKTNEIRQKWIEAIQLAR